MEIPKSKRIRDRALLNMIRMLPCLVCGKGGCDPAHIKSVGSGGPDLEFNVVPLCRKHHTEHGQIGWIRFFDKYPEFYLKLKLMGWEVGPFSKLTHPRIKYG